MIDPERAVCIAERRRSARNLTAVVPETEHICLAVSVVHVVDIDDEIGKYVAENQRRGPLVKLRQNRFPALQLLAAAAPFGICGEIVHELLEPSRVQVMTHADHDLPAFPLDPPTLVFVHRAHGPGHTRNLSVHPSIPPGFQVAKPMPAPVPASER